MNTPATIRKARSADIPQIFALERASATSAHWAQSDYSRLASELDSNRRLALVVESGVAEERLLGFLIARNIDSEWEIENVVIAESAQRMGLGSRLLGEVIDIARRNSAENIFLEVRESNRAAIALYNKSGFKQDGRRKNYYSNPDEDALLLRLALERKL